MASVQRNGVTVVHGPGQRMIVNRPDGRVIVTNRAGHGYVQRGFTYGGYTYVSRTYYVRGQVYSRYYRPYVYHGIELHRYVPVRYYSPVFYGWAYRPWGAPVAFRWGWMGAPWYSWYGGYFVPAPYYPSPAYWLADYLIATQLALAYQDRGTRPAAYVPGNQITPEIREQIANEVQRQLALERQEAQSLGGGQVADSGEAGPGWLAGSSHVFVVSYNVEVQDQQRQMCSVTRGDVLQLSGPVPAGSRTAWVRVLSSTAGSCPRGDTVAVELADLQDMDNQMRETMSQGMGELYSKAGQSGIPALPQGANVQPAAAAFVEAAPPPDPNVGTELVQQVQEVDQLERDAVAEARAEGAGPDVVPAPGPRIELREGQKMEDVQKLLGEPLQVVKMGDKEIHTYRDVKVTFVKGKVTDIQ